MALCSSLTLRLAQHPTPSVSTSACAFRYHPRAQAAPAAPAPANRGAGPHPRPSPRVSCDAAAGLSYSSREDMAYFSDEDLSRVDARPEAEGPSSWLDSNYVSLSVTCYRLMQQKSQEALQQHFQKRGRVHSRRQASRRDAFRGAAAAASSTLQSAAKAKQGAHHACCAPSRDHTFVCGDDEAVAWAVAPACLHSGDHFIGTP